MRIFRYVYLCVSFLLVQICQGQELEARVSVNHQQVEGSNASVFESSGSSQIRFSTCIAFSGCVEVELMHILPPEADEISVFPVYFSTHGKP